MLLSVADYNLLYVRLPLRLVLVVPFVLQIFAAVGLVGYLSFRNGQKAIDNLATQLQTEVSWRIDQHLDTYLATPHQINQINADAIKLGLLNPQDLPGMGHYFWKQMQVFNVGFINYVLATGEYTGAGYFLDPSKVTIDELSPNTKDKTYTYATDSQGNRTKVVAIYDTYEPQKEAPYQDTIKAGKPTWSKVFPWDDFPDILAISAGYPIYNNTNTLLGVLYVDFRLGQIRDFLSQVKISPQGKTFIVERNGLLVASSTAEKPFTVVNGKAQRLLVADSSDVLIRATARHLIERFGNLTEIKASLHLNFTLNGQRQFVQVTPWRDKFGLDWLIVVSIPESDFMTQINANTRTSIWLCLGALGLAILLGTFTSRWITQPILRLSEASQALAEAARKGNAIQGLDQKSVQRVKELSVLVQSFNQMAGQLEESFTALEKTKEEAEAAKLAADVANRAKSKFLATMSHELRTPLNGILGYAQILQWDKTVSPKQQDGLSIIHQCGSHLLKLINDVLDISKIEAQKLELYPTDFHFEKFLLGVCALCRITAAQKEIIVNYQALNQLPSAIHADEKRLRQVLINLLGNAIKFTATGGVTFKVGVLDGSYLNSERITIHKIRFSVEDTGIGMTPEQIEKIFLPFEQVGDSLRKAEGTGLGLAISSTIVEMMGSEIKVLSTYGEGSKFWFDLDLPEAKDWISLASSPSEQNIISYQGEPKTILIVDDRWENRAVIVNLLEPINFKLIEANNGQEGLDKARKFKPDLIIADLAMPVMDGFEMTQRLRDSEEFKDTVIIASTALAFNLERQHREAGYDDVLSKPMQASELLLHLQHYLKLTWIYESNQELIPEQSASTQVGEMVIPPKEELTALYQAAKAGYISGIQEEANRLMQLNHKYTTFAQQVLKLAEDFEDEAIVKLVEPYLF